MKGCNPGDYNCPIVVESLSGTADSFGHVDTTDSANWSRLTTAWAKVQTKGGREFWKVDRVEADVSHVWRCPYSATLATATPDMRLVYSSTNHEIVSVIDIDEAHEVIEIQTRRAT